MMKIILLLCAAVTVLSAAVQSDAPWHHPLYLDNGGYWPKRIQVSLENTSAKSIAGEPVEVSISALTGEPVESLRVCRADGVELLFDLQDQNRRLKRAGDLAPEDRLIFPVECPANAVVNIYVYAGNKEAWGVPDFLPPGFQNGGFELGDEVPDGWKSYQADEQHELTWEFSGGRDGERCVKAQVAAGAPATWVQWRQDGIPLVPGRVYQFSGWVRADQVTGSAGWFVHVNGEQPQLLNRTLDAGRGTYDWKQIAVSFTAPAQARFATLGTVLHGTGQAWFDDAMFHAVEGKTNFRIQVGPIERRRLSIEECGFKSRELWDFVATARARNFGDQAVESALVHLDLRPVYAKTHGLRSGAEMRLQSAKTAHPFFWLEGEQDLFFATDIPPRTEREFHLSLRKPAEEMSSALSGGYQDLLRHAVNLAPEGDFENQAAATNFWLTPNPGSNVSFGFSQDAKFGRQGLELNIASNLQANWVGWRSGKIAVKPGARYLFSGYLKAIGLKGSASFHAHWHTQTGKLTVADAYASTQPQVSSDTDWLNSRAFLAAPPDAAFIVLHLTMNAEGALRHDGILFAEVLDAPITKISPGKRESHEQSLQVWQVNPLVKVFPDSLPGKPSMGVAVELARNEFEPFQLALRGRNGGSVSNLNVSVSSLRNAAGAELPRVRIERVGFVPIDHPSAYYRADLPDWCRKIPRGSSQTDGWADWWPDPLIPNHPCDVGQDQTQPIWFTVRATKEAMPGDYHGEVAFRADPQIELALPLTVKVLPFTLPDETQLQVLFDFRRGRGGWFGPEATSPEAYRKWLRFMAEHRLGIDQINPPPKFSYRNGKVTMEAAGFDETARFCFDELGMNASYTPWFFYMFGWAYPPKNLFGLEPFTPEWTDAFQQAYRLFTDHLRANGWLDKFVYYISDEPHFSHPFVVEQMQKLCALIHEVDRTIPIYSSTWRHCAAWDDSLDLWGIGQYGCFPLAEMERLQKSGKQMWFTCDGQMATDTPYLATERMLPYYCFKYGAQGFEFWGLTWWTYNPWETGWHSYIRQSNEGKDYYWVRYPNGDGYLTYPGKAVGVDGPVSTIRLEQVREGLEDFEALTLLSDLARKAHQTGRATRAADRAQALARELVSIPNAGGLRSTEILPDPDRVPAIRQAINAAIVELVR